MQLMNRHQASMVCLTPTYTNSSTRRTRALLTKPYRNITVCFKRFKPENKKLKINRKIY